MDNEVQRSCWFADGVCPECGKAELATDGRTTWCCSLECYNREVRRAVEELQQAPPTPHLDPAHSDKDPPHPTHNFRRTK